ncbi:MAG: histidine phosphatase family protein [Pseudorhodobacter sp.]
MRRFFWVRHGPTHVKAMLGWTDMPADLSDHAALARLSSALPKVPVISSDLSRAVMTADAILDGRTRLPHHAGLREINFGAWEMKHHGDIADQARLRRYWEDPGDIAPPDGESWNDVSRRVDETVAELLQSQQSDLILVAHFGVILTQLRHALGISAQKVFAHRIDNLSITELVHDNEGWKAAGINHIVTD